MALMFRSCLRIKLLPNCSSIAVTSKTEYKNITILVDYLFCKLIMFIYPTKYGSRPFKTWKGFALSRLSPIPSWQCKALVGWLPTREVETHTLNTHGNGLGHPTETVGWERDRRRVYSESFLGLTPCCSCSWLCKSTKAVLLLQLRYT